MENRSGDREAATFSSSAASNMRARTSNATTTSTGQRDLELSQFNADAGIMYKFEQSDASGESFNYSRSVLDAPQVVPEAQMTAYLSRMQRGGFIQPFGCLLAIQESSFKIISYSENCFEQLGLNNQFESVRGRGLIGVDIRALFTPPSGASLMRAAASRDISLSNPVWVNSRTTQKPFYAILHRIDVGIVIDLEPARLADPALSLAGAVQSQKLAVRAISRLQAFPGGDIGFLCDTVVEDIKKLTGYDRVMVYKFHDDGHGEVVSEIRRSDMEPYLGLHYPALDIPQAARFLFKQNLVRMICDCNAKPVQIIQSDELRQPLCLVNSTLRSPHSCHQQYMANMSCIASLAMAVIVNSDDSPRKLWGLVVCHHTSPRHVNFPLRYACEFLMQAFGLQLFMELQLAEQLAEKKVLKTQTLLCDMLLRDSPYGMLSQSPSIMDLVKCEGAALYYDGSCWLLGVTPTEEQVKDIAEWVSNNHEDSTGLSTVSLSEAGYPGAASLGDTICGMAAARITSKDFLFWFRATAAKAVKWGGAKHHPGDKDNGEKMHPRTSFKTFVEVTKSRSLPWEVSEINAIHSLQLIMRESILNTKDSDSMATSFAQQGDTEIQDVNELSSVACEMVRLIETATAPVFGVDTTGMINGWNARISKLMQLEASEALGKSLINEIAHEDSRVIVQDLLFRALQGQEDKNVELKLKSFGADMENSTLYIIVNACTSRDYTNKIIGVCFVGQDVTSERVVMDKFIHLQGDYKTIIQSLNPLIPPIFVSDENGYCSEWTAAMEKLTGWKRDEVMGKMLAGEIFGNFCRLKVPGDLTRFMILLYQGIGGQETEKLPLGFFDKNGNFVEVLLTSNKRTGTRGNIIGCICFLQVVEPNSQQVLEELEQLEDTHNFLKELAYIKQEMKNPLNGIKFTHELLENSGITENQKLFLDTSDACERQIMAIIEDINLRSLEGGNVELNTKEFLLGNVLDAIICQNMNFIRENNLQLYHEIPEEIKILTLHGDQIKLQMVLSDFLFNAVRYAPVPDGWIEIKVSPGLKLIQDGNELIHLTISMSHSGQGLPPDLVQDMVGGGQQCSSQEGLGLNLSRKLLDKLNGSVQYVREQSKCYFLIDLECRKRLRRSSEAETSRRV